MESHRKIHVHAQRGTFYYCVTHREKCFTLNVTVPSVIIASSSSCSVMSFHACKSSPELQCKILTWPGNSCANSVLPSRSVRGILIVTGSKCGIFRELEMSRIGPTNKLSPLSSLLGNSCTLGKSQNKYYTYTY